jgi:hypothetical protein
MGWIVIVVSFVGDRSKEDRHGAWAAWTAWEAENDVEVCPANIDTGGTGLIWR